MRSKSLRRAAAGGALAVLLLAGAACSASGGAAGGVPASLANGPTCDAGHQITLTVWSYYTTLTVLNKLDGLFKKVCPNVTVKQVLIPGTQLDPKLLATASTHNGPDVLLNNVVVDFPELQRAGVMYNLTKFWNAYPDKAQYPASGIWRTANGQIYTVMSYTNLVGFWYNKSVLGQYNITSPPATIAQMDADMKKVVAGGKYQGLAESGAPSVEGAWLFMPLLLDQGINYCNLSGPKVTAAFAQVQSWAKNKLIPNATSTWTQNDSWQEFVTGKFAFGLVGNWNLVTAKSQAKFTYGTGEFPANDPSGKTTVFPGGEGLAIGAFTQYPGVAWKYLETSWLSKQANILDFTNTGSIPLRKDVATTSILKDDALVQPFITAASDSAKWPDNPQTAAMQTAVGQAVSGVISGQLTPAAAAAQAEAGVANARKAGGGGC
jgi:multiple sugar transport system substrate-binding protein